MPVYKFRSVEEMPGETWLTPGDPALYGALDRLWATSRAIAPARFVPGVWKHRTMADLNRQRDEWTNYPRRKI